MVNRLRPLLFILLGVALGVVGARYVLVGSALILVPWGLIAALIGVTAPSQVSLTTTAAGYGFALTFAFMIASYDGSTSVTHYLLLFTLLGLFGATCAELLALAGCLAQSRTRRARA